MKFLDKLYAEIAKDKTIKQIGAMIPAKYLRIIFLPLCAVWLGFFVWPALYYLTKLATIPSPGYWGSVGFVMIILFLKGEKADRAERREKRPGSDSPPERDMRTRPRGLSRQTRRKRGGRFVFDKAPAKNGQGGKGDKGDKETDEIALEDVKPCDRNSE